MGIIADVCALAMMLLGMFSKPNGLENVLCFIAAAIFMVAGAIYYSSKKKERFLCPKTFALRTI